MQTLGIIFTVLNAIVFFTLSIFRKTKELLHEAEQYIKDEFSEGQLSFSRVLLAPVIEDGQLVSLVGRLKQIVFVGHSDIHILRRYRRELLFSIIIAVTGFVFSLASLVTGAIYIKPDIGSNILPRIFFIIPGVVSVLELVILCRALFVEDRAKALKEKYRTREY